MLRQNGAYCISVIHNTKQDLHNGKAGIVSVLMTKLMLFYGALTVLSPYSPTIRKNMLCIFLQDFLKLNVTQLLIGQIDGLGNQKLYYIQMLLYCTKVKTPHIYSRSKIALIL